ncbi:MAG: sigma-70 family RNA polymerase sigma factor [Bacteroidales bacterium]|jgi:RNA polymerase sigma-70 factor (ECF subfamily)|nr:sigma-70 family RNA polymerase sigma factor [Bacteroidales bacterium]
MTPANINSGSASFNPGNDLIEACRRNDHKAQLQIYKLYYKSVYGICLRIVSDPATAEDIMHEAFLSAFENIGSYCCKTSFYSWLNGFIKYE